ncbi:hypothetical protein [Streptacidiphilus neutrinimicus]|uniref:hypothetical protein n=1 Tax=Streptacidiphilus neutrinimicus TaxID=105420 RepID=UPI001F19010B|nr:hypothetical protein [Streptacidiphilus neutrinimicus]
MPAAGVVITTWRVIDNMRALHQLRAVRQDLKVRWRRAIGQVHSFSLARTSASSGSPDSVPALMHAPVHTALQAIYLNYNHSLGGFAFSVTHDAESNATWYFAGRSGAPATTANWYHLVGVYNATAHPPASAATRSQAAQSPVKRPM